MKSLIKLVNGRFRPLTRIIVLIEVSRKDILKVFRQFPSPYGDYGSYRTSRGTAVSWKLNMFPSPYGDYGSYHGTCSGLQHYSCLRFRPLTGIMVLIKSDLQDVCYRLADVSVPLRGLWFLSAPLINGFIAPSKMPFAGRIFFSPHFSHFCGKWFSKIVLSLIFKPAGRNNSFYVFKKQVGRINTVLPN